MTPTVLQFEAGADPDVQADLLLPYPAGVFHWQARVSFEGTAWEVGSVLGLEDSADLGFPGEGSWAVQIRWGSSAVVDDLWSDWSASITS